MNQEEANYISKHSLKKFTGDPEIQIAFLKELDNIISASVISKLSQVLSAKVYGDVPFFELCNSSEQVIEHIKKETASFSRSYVNIVEIIVDDHVNIAPLFVWIMDEKFLTVAEQHGYAIELTSEKRSDG